jgi:hypothetical protein
MLDMCWGRQTFSESIGDHILGNKIAYKVSADIDMARVFSPYGVFTHGHACQIIFIDLGDEAHRRETKLKRRMCVSQFGTNFRNRIRS